MIHVVEQGDCLHHLADRYGFEKWQSIYDHPDNAELRSARPNPELLYPGDRVFIPDRASKAEACATNRTHAFRVNRPKVKLHVFLTDDNKQPLKNVRYAVRARRFDVEGKTTSEGLVDQLVPASLSSTQLLVWLDDESETPDLAYTLQLGGLDPIDKVSGVRERLRNLGYRLTGDDERSESMAAAIRAFRADHGLEDSVELDDEFRVRLLRAHDRE